MTTKSAEFFSERRRRGFEPATFASATNHNDDDDDDDDDETEELKGDERMKSGIHSANPKMTIIPTSRFDRLSSSSSPSSSACRPHPAAASSSVGAAMHVAPRRRPAPPPVDLPVRVPISFDGEEGHDAAARALAAFNAGGAAAGGAAAERVVAPPNRCVEPGGGVGGDSPPPPYRRLASGADFVEGIDAKNHRDAGRRARTTPRRKPASSASSAASERKKKGVEVDGAARGILDGILATIGAIKFHSTRTTPGGETAPSGMTPGGMTPRMKKSASQSRYFYASPPVNATSGFSTPPPPPAFYEDDAGRARCHSFSTSTSLASSLSSPPPSYDAACATGASSERWRAPELEGASIDRRAGGPASPAQRLHATERQSQQQQQQINRNHLLNTDCNGQGKRLPPRHHLHHQHQQQKHHHPEQLHHHPQQLHRHQPQQHLHQELANPDPHQHKLNEQQQQQQAVKTPTSPTPRRPLIASDGVVSPTGVEVSSPALLCQSPALFCQSTSLLQCTGCGERKLLLRGREGDRLVTLEDGADLQFASLNGADWNDIAKNGDAKTKLAKSETEFYSSDAVRVELVENGAASSSSSSKMAPVERNFSGHTEPASVRDEHPGFKTMSSTAAASAAVSAESALENSPSVSLQSPRPLSRPLPPTNLPPFPPSPPPLSPSPSPPLPPFLPLSFSLGSETLLVSSSLVCDSGVKNRRSSPVIHDTVEDETTAPSDADDAGSNQADRSS